MIILHVKNNHLACIHNQLACTHIYVACTYNFLACIHNYLEYIYIIILHVCIIHLHVYIIILHVYIIILHVYINILYVYTIILHVYINILQVYMYMILLHEDVVAWNRLPHYWPIGHRWISITRASNGERWWFLMQIVAYWWFETSRSRCSCHFAVPKRLLMASETENDWPLLLTWLNLNPTMNKQSHVQESVRWNYCWSLRMDK